MLLVFGGIGGAVRLVEWLGIKAGTLISRAKPITIEFGGKTIRVTGAESLDELRELLLPPNCA